MIFLNELSITHKREGIIPSFIQTSQLRYYIEIRISKARRQSFYSLASIPSHSRHHNETILLISNETFHYT